MPSRHYGRRHNRLGLAHFLTIRCFHCLPALDRPELYAQLNETVESSCCLQHTELWGYVFLPDHLHLLIRPQRRKYSLREFIGGLKRDFEITKSV